MEKRNGRDLLGGSAFPLHARDLPGIFAPRARIDFDERTGQIVFFDRMDGVDAGRAGFCGRGAAGKG